MTGHQRGCPLFTHPTQRGPGHGTECACSWKLRGDTLRVVAYFREHPDSTVNEARAALWTHITARMSDARTHGIVFAASESRASGRRVVRFRVVEPRPIDRGEQQALAL